MSVDFDPFTLTSPRRVSRAAKDVAFCFFLVGVVSALAMTANPAWAAYRLPIGVPDPGFGVADAMPSRPSPWSSAVAGYYFIDQAIGTDTGRAYGYPDAPRKTLPLPMPAGSYVEIRGTYSVPTGGVIRIQANGTSGPWIAGTSGPVWLTSSDPTTPSTIGTSSYKALVWGSYLYLDNLTIDGRGGTDHTMLQVGSSSTGYGADHVSIRNCRVYGNASMVQDSAVSLVGNSASPVSDVVIFNNRISESGNPFSATDDDAHATVVQNYVSNVWFLDNEIFTSSGSGTQIGGATSGSDNCHHIFFGRNRVYNTRQAGLAIKYANDVILSQNTVSDIINTSWSESKCIGFQYVNTRIWIIYNTLSNARWGIREGSDGSSVSLDHYIIGNVIHNIHHVEGAYGGGTPNEFHECGIGLWGSGNHQYIIGNTVVNADSGIMLAYDSYATLENNIVADISEATGWHVNVATTSQGDELRASLFQQGVGNVRIKWGSTLYESLSRFQSATGKGQLSLQGDPLFAGRASADYRLTRGSPARNTGISPANLLSDVFALYRSTYGVGIEYDHSNNVRPAEEGWDIGAEEYVPSPAPALSPPSNLVPIQ